MLRRVNPKKLEKYLQDHPDRELVEYLVDGYTNGFSLGVDRRPSPWPPCPNLREARRKPEITQALVDKEVALGHMLGPFDEPPLPDMVFSPLNIVPKAGSKDKYRLIHDLAYPYNSESVNSCIPTEHASVQYHTIDEVIDMGMQLGTGTFAGREDIEHAFRNQPIRFSDLALLGFTLNEKYYINCSVPFGAASSCFIFEKVASALQWIITNETGCEWISHFLDDFPLLENSFDALQNLMTEFKRLMADIGMPVAISKSLGPTQVLQYLGLILNFKLQRIEIPEDKRIKCMNLVSKLIEVYERRAKTTVKQIQKVAGSLNFLCQALPAGRPFLCSLYRATRTAKGDKRRGGNHRRLNFETYEDLKMFKTFLKENAHVKVKTVPFLNRLNIDNDKIEMYADAAGAADKGIGCIFGDEWFHGKWSETDLFKNGYRPNIALLELTAITVGFEIWAPRLAGRTVTLRSDNATTVCFLNKKKADIPAAMQLLRRLTLSCLRFQITVRAVHIKGILNTESDLVSRGKLREFHTRRPTAKKEPQKAPEWWPPSWSKKEMERYQ